MKKKNNCIILTGGGTAGHVMPNINLSPEFHKHFDKIVYIGSKDGIEQSLVSKNTDYTYEEITTVKFDRSKIFKNLLIPFKLIKGKLQAKKLMKKYQPSVVFSKGGYVGLPVIMAAKNLKIPVVCHESDISMGLANKIGKMYATKICTNFEITSKQNGKKCEFTGSPIVLSKLSKQEAKNKLGISSTKPVLLVMGGSLGAKAINSVVFNNIDALTKKFFIIHIVGKGNKTDLKSPNYMQIEFSNDMCTIYRATDFALSRAGANSIVELLSNHILTIFVPLPKGVSRGDQVQNAKFLECNNLSKTIEQHLLTPQNLLDTLDYLGKNKIQIISAIDRFGFKDGTKKIMDIILKEKSA